MSLQPTGNFLHTIFYEHMDDISASDIGQAVIKPESIQSILLLNFELSENHFMCVIIVIFVSLFVLFLYALNFIVRIGSVFILFIMFAEQYFSIHFYL